MDPQRGHVEDSCIQIPANSAVLNGEFTSVPEARGLVIFATGNGSGRHSPRNRYVVDFLRSHAGVSTLVVDLLSTSEAGCHMTARRLAFDMDLMRERLVAVTDWARHELDFRDLPVGYFAASTGAAAALLASTERSEVRAVVSRGGRPDLAGATLGDVTVPTLLIAGQEDQTLLELNRAAQARLVGERELKIVPGSSYLFEEPQALDEVATSAGRWFLRHLCRRPEHSEVLTAPRLG